MLHATMRVAPVDPENVIGIECHFTCQVLRQAAVPFTSSVVHYRKTERMFLYGAAWGQAGKVSGPASNRVCFVARAQAIRASLLARAQATTLE